MANNKLVQAFQYLVAYQVVLEDRIEKNKKELHFFDDSFRELAEDSLVHSEKELKELNELIKNWRDGW